MHLQLAMHWQFRVSCVSIFGYPQFWVCTILKRKRNGQSSTNTFSDKKMCNENSARNSIHNSVLEWKQKYFCYWTQRECWKFSNIFATTIFHQVAFSIFGSIRTLFRYSVSVPLCLVFALSLSYHFYENVALNKLKLYYKLTWKKICSW